MLDRFGVAAALREIAGLLELEGGNPYRARAYERGARALEALSADLATLVEEGRLTTVPGVGRALAATITELHRTGTTSVLERLRQQFPPGALELATVLSPPKVAAVQQALGVTTLQALREAAASGRLRTVKGFGPASERKVLAAIDRLAAAPEEMLLDHATREGEAVRVHLAAHPEALEVALAGALRRRAETVDRLVVVVGSAAPEAIVDHVARFPPVVTLLAREDDTVRVRLSEGALLEAHVVPPEVFPVALCRRTGTDGHVRKLEVVAQARGMTFDEKGVRRGGRSLAVEAEADIYRHLGLPEIPPEMREDAGEVEAAVRGTLPAPLVTVDDIRGMIHCHTVYSDGKHTVEEMARGAEALGMSYLTITDHSSSARYAGGLPLDRLKRQWEEIDRVQESVKVRLLRGTESDILADGSLDYPDDVLEKMDVVIASIHNRFRMDEDRMTRRLVGALRQPLFKIWGHALGRYVLSRPPIPCRMEEVLDAAAESRVAIEINGNPQRLDMEPRWVREAKKRGLRFVVSTDAHSIAEMNHLRYGIDMARKGWLTKDDVLNAQDVEAFRRAVRP